MPILINELRTASILAKAQPHITLGSALSRGISTAFLCHSHKDNDLAEGLEAILTKNGWNLYIDWKDHEMLEKPNKETAERIKRKITDLNWFLFLATPNSSTSRWCPWEIGIADTRKSHDKILIIPTTDNSGAWYGNEYLQLYSKIDTTKGGGLARFDVGQQHGTYVRNLR